jgi:uncharacterized protein with NAD-binding domain and iron-sulfur cluster
MFDNIYKLDGVPVVTVQLRYNGWVTELQDLEKSRWLKYSLFFITSLLIWFRPDKFECTPPIT